MRSARAASRGGRRVVHTARASCTPTARQPPRSLESRRADGRRRRGGARCGACASSRARSSSCRRRAISGSVPAAAATSCRIGITLGATSIVNCPHPWMMRLGSRSVLPRVRPPLRVQRPFTGQSPFANRAHQASLPAEPLVDGFLGHARRRGDRLDRRRLESIPHEQPFGGADDGFVRSQGAGPAARCVVAAPALAVRRLWKRGAAQLRYSVLYQYVKESSMMDLTSGDTGVSVLRTFGSGDKRPRHRRNRGVLRLRLPQRPTGTPKPEFRRPRAGTPELGADSRLRAGHARRGAPMVGAGRRVVVGMGAARDTARRHSASHARRDHLRRRGRCHRVGSLLPRARAAGGGNVDDAVRAQVARTAAPGATPPEGR